MEKPKVARKIKLTDYTIMQTLGTGTLLLPDPVLTSDRVFWKSPVDKIESQQ